MAWLARPPKLFRFNGVGTALYGKRDLDPRTGSYVKTLVFTVFFIPVCCMAAYRVVDAPGSSSWFLLWGSSWRSWYIGQRVPLSTLARRWNWFVGAVVAVMLAASLPGR